VVYWSEKHRDREMRANAGFVEYLGSVIANPDKLKDKQKKIERFLVKTQYDKKTGEVLKPEVAISLDTEKIQEYMDLMGYYTILTSETGMSDREIIDKRHGLSRIEDSFRIIKSDLEGRPVYVRKPERVNAHFLLCFVVLTMMRLVQRRVLLHLGKKTTAEDGWEAGLSASRIVDALNAFETDALPGGYYRLTKPTDDMRLILDAIGVDADLRLPDLKGLRGLKRNIDAATIM
jgi:hypothetical protein